MVDLGDSRQVLMIDLAQHGVKARRARTQLNSLPTRHQTQHKISSFALWRN